MSMNITYIRGKKNERILTAVGDAAKTSGITLSVGWFEGQRYEDGASIAAIAKRNEYGGVNEKGYIIPPRPFMRPTIQKHKQQWRYFIKKGISKGVQTGKLSMENLFSLLGNMVKGQIQESIGNVRTPKLSPFTVYNRLARYVSGVLSNAERWKKAHEAVKSGASLAKPLEDTGIMKASVSYKVEERGAE